jgi:hypothetical protein
MRGTRFAILCSLALTLAPSIALAQQATATAEPDDQGPVLGPLPTPEYIEAVNRRGRGFGIGADMGVWGTGFGQGLHVDVPFGWDIGQFFGLRLRGVFAHGSPEAAAFDPVVLGGAELFGRGPVMMGIVRVYGGGGIHVGGRPSPDGGGEKSGLSGGGHIGLEAFSTPGFAGFVEVGGQGAIHPGGIDAGPSVMAGGRLYLGGG